MLKKYKDIYSGIFMLLLAALIFIGSFSIKMLTVSRIGAAFVPQLIAILMAMLSISVIINGIKRIKVVEVLQNVEEEKKEEVPVRTFSVAATIGLLLVYVSLLEKVGFMIMTAIYLFFQIYVLADKSQRKLPLFAVIAIVVSVGVYYLFVNAFDLMLPAGILG
ncbi:MAG: hypothetical protein PWQ70_1161 [Clostridiales bacterium]|jgi:hypothetical protein|nr:hypothetical protein [Clostridiales bacterium]